MTRKAMLVDLARCAGCGACVVACQMQNNTRPGIAWVKMDRSEWGDYPNSEGRCYVPHACMHCDDPACVAACPTGASYQNEEGVTLTDYDLCIACGSCEEACPYHARRMNMSTEWLFDAAEPSPYEAYGVQRSNVSEKCIFCNELTKEGRLPACVVNCPGRARSFGDIENPEDPIYELAKNATNIGASGFYYVKPEGMSSSNLISILMRASSPESQTPEPGVDAGDSGGGINPVIVGVGGAAVVAAGVGAGLVYNKRRKAKSEEGASDESN